MGYCYLSASIFVKSLDFTSWDDQYTFSLNSALGCLGMMSDEELPDNVNYDTNFDDKKMYQFWMCKRH